MRINSLPLCPLYLRVTLHSIKSRQVSPLVISTLRVQGLMLSRDASGKGPFA
ncbi:hypothetical protein [Paenibacillus tianjinensis]|uniref:Uncharacterized protein n=1 Tax=Paenibacillus tianjinensis TaxID=2810347 RepID=A0ABX7LBD8_9BACL|nr:hypothetical protein [Paenibacillus tianjinensis]QSF44688.1 hypothetical protein JRJ22_26640 [Paenibacillus tianjinensis]